MERSRLLAQLTDELETVKAEMEERGLSVKMRSLFNFKSYICVQKISFSHETNIVHFKLKTDLCAESCTLKLYLLSLCAKKQFPFFSIFTKIKKGAR